MLWIHKGVELLKTTKLILGTSILLLLLLSGCSIEDTNSEGMKKVEDFNDVLVFINASGQKTTSINCYNSEDYSQSFKINHSFYGFDDYSLLTSYLNDGESRYRIRHPEIYTNYKAIEWSEEFLNKSDGFYNVDCSVRLFTSDDDIIATTYDEGYKETMKIALWETFHITCRRDYIEYKWDDCSYSSFGVDSFDLDYWLGTKMDDILEKATGKGDI